MNGANFQGSRRNEDEGAMTDTQIGNRSTQRKLTPGDFMLKEEFAYEDIITVLPSHKTNRTRPGKGTESRHGSITKKAEWRKRVCHCWSACGRIGRGTTGRPRTTYPPTMRVWWVEKVQGPVKVPPQRKQLPTVKQAAGEREAASGSDRRLRDADQAR